MKTVRQLKERAIDALYFETESEVGIRQEYGEDAYQDYKASLRRIFGKELFEEIITEVAKKSENV